MASAYKCDRCGKIYEPSDFKDKDKETILIAVAFRDAVEDDYGDLMDICPQCSSELLCWYKNKDTTVCHKIDCQIPLTGGKLI